MYTDINFKTKKEFKEAVKKGEQVTFYQPGGLYSGVVDGNVAIEGPHYPQPHKWYAQCKAVNGLITEVR